ncbi:hypothetical protein [Actinoalloteichus spitiensis]|uniref:hypothetical protein n=1 Tax=Actinoalloteichus spitiensis TaxID=252394 RepID=UPI000380B7A0|nr:hypothetical protein [Actinoalloteichus spitiensis]
MILEVLVAVLAVVVLAGGALLFVAVRRSRNGTSPQPLAAETPRPVRGSPAQVWAERAERAARAIASATAGRPELSGVHDDVELVLVEVRSSAAEVARLDGLSRQDLAPELRAEWQRLSQAANQAADEVTRSELAGAAASVADRLRAAEARQGAKETLLARMQGAVAGLERSRTEIVELTSARTSAVTVGDPVADLADRLRGLRSGLVEVQRLSAAGGAPGSHQGQPPDVPGSLEPRDGT